MKTSGSITNPKICGQTVVNGFYVLMKQLTANAIEELLKCGNMWNLKHFSGMLSRHIQIVLVALIND